MSDKNTHMKDDMNGNEFNELFNDLKLHEPLKKIEVSILFIYSLYQN